MAKTFEAKTVAAPIGSNKLFSKCTPKFLFMHHPNTWDLVETSDGWEVLPMLTKFQLIPGLNGVKHSAGGAIDSTAARASFMDRGWTFIDNKAAGNDGYLREYEGSSGPIYVDKWSTPRTLGHGGRARVVWDSDVEGYNDFRRSLLESGIIAKPDPAALDLKIELLRKRVERKVKNAHIEHVAGQIKDAEEKKEALETAKATKKTKAPKRKRATKKAKADV